MHEDGHIIWIMSGRREDTKEATLEWLEKNEVPWDYISMRGVGDRTQDTELKINWAKTEKLYADEDPVIHRILFVLEDRQRMVDAWREEGITCFQVRPGNF